MQTTFNNLPDEIKHKYSRTLYKSGLGVQQVANILGCCRPIASKHIGIKTPIQPSPSNIYINEKNAAWLASAIDGEGTIGLYIHSNTGTPQPRLAVTNTNTRYLERCIEIAKCGKIYIKSKSYNPNPRAKIGHQWFCHVQSDILAILLNITDELVIKREQAIIVSSYIVLQHELSIPERKQFAESLAALNHRGCSSPPMQLLNSLEQTKAKLRSLSILE